MVKTFHMIFLAKSMPVAGSLSALKGDTWNKKRSATPILWHHNCWPLSVRGSVLDSDLDLARQPRCLKRSSAHPMHLLVRKVESEWRQDLCKEKVGDSASDREEER
jgi:hypothetical protein